MDFDASKLFRSVRMSENYRLFVGGGIDDENEDEDEDNVPYQFIREMIRDGEPDNKLY